MKNILFSAVVVFMALDSAWACRPNLNRIHKQLVNQALIRLDAAGIDSEDYELPSRSEQTLKLRYLRADTGIDCPDTYELSFRIYLESEQSEKLSCYRKLFVTRGLLGEQSFVSEAHCHPNI